MAKITHTIHGLTNGVTYYGKVYTVNPKKRANNRVDLPVFEAVPSAGIDLSTFPTGNTIRLNVNGTPRRFIIVHQGLPSTSYDSSCDGTWLLMEDLHESRAWDSSNNDYENSDVDSYLNSTFLGLLDSDVQAKIKQVKIPYTKGTGSSGTVTNKSSGLSAKVFLLSLIEAMGKTFTYGNTEGAKLSYFDGAEDARRVAKLNGTATAWWLRSPNANHTSQAWVVADTGSTAYRDRSVTAEGGIRPALILPSDTKISLEPNADGSYSLA